MFKHIFKYSLNILGLLTGFAVAIFVAFPDVTSVLEAAAKMPLMTLAIGLVLLIWAISILILSTVLLFSEKKREEAFLMTSYTEIRDELEEKAVSDAIKRTFIFNLALLAFVFALSGFSYTNYKTKTGETTMSFGYSLWQEDTQESKDAVANLINNLPKEKQDKLKANGLSIEVTDDMIDNTNFLLPRRFLSSFGVLCLILIQFLTFKLFLFLNLRSLNSED